jgi:hypothetical protein
MKTQTAVIGVVGTDVITISTPDSTTVICLDGSVKVCGTNPVNPGCVTLQPGQFTTVPLNGAPTAPAAASQSILQSELGQLLIQTGGQLGSVGPWPILQTVAGGATIGLLGVTISELGNASSSSTQASTILTGVAGTLNGATGSLNNAANTFGNFPTIWNNIGCALNNWSGSLGESTSTYTPPPGYTCP